MEAPGGHRCRRSGVDVLAGRQLVAERAPLGGLLYRDDGRLARGGHEDTRADERSALADGLPARLPWWTVGRPGGEAIFLRRPGRGSEQGRPARLGVAS